LGKWLDCQTTTDGAVTIVVQVTDSFNKTFNATFNIRILDVNDPPYFKTTEYEVDENSKTGTTVVAFEIGDDDALTNKPWLKAREPQTLQLQANGDLSPFKLVRETLVLVKEIDHERTPFYTFEMVVIDSGDTPSQTVKVCTVTIRDTGEPPSLVLLSNNKTEEMAARSETKVGTVVGEITMFDEDLRIRAEVTIAPPHDATFGVGRQRCDIVEGSDWPAQLKDRQYTRCTMDLKVAGKLTYHDGAVRPVVVLITDTAGTQAFKFDITILNVRCSFL
jgi:hypothetical protein